MEKKLIALVFIALLAGLGGGYGLGYIVYQPQVQSLQSDVVGLNDTLDIINSTIRNTQLSITSLQNEQNSLNSEVISLDSIVKKIENRTWYMAVNLARNISVEMTEHAVSEKFEVKGHWIRIRWYVYGFTYFYAPSNIIETSWIRIDIKFSNGTTYTDRGSSGEFGSFASDLDIEPGEYYLEIWSQLVDNFLVVVWDYY